MSVNVTVVVIHRVLIEVLQDHITNLTVIPFQVSIAPTLPAKENRFQFYALFSEHESLPSGHPLLNVLEKSRVKFVERVNMGK